MYTTRESRINADTEPLVEGKQKTCMIKGTCMLTGTHLLAWELANSEAPQKGSRRHLVITCPGYFACPGKFTFTAKQADLESI